MRNAERTRNERLAALRAASSGLETKKAKESDRQKARQYYQRRERELRAKMDETLKQAVERADRDMREVKLFLRHPDADYARRNLRNDPDLKAAKDALRVKYNESLRRADAQFDAIWQAEKQQFLRMNAAEQGLYLIWEAVELLGGGLAPTNKKRLRAALRDSYLANEKRLEIEFGAAAQRRAAR